MDCLFCKIINKEIPCFSVYEDDQALVFLDIAPINDGHVLIVPKKHCENMLDCDEKILSHIINLVPKIAKAAMVSLNYEAFNLGVNNGAIAGQVIPHLHFHIMPRKAGDGHCLFKGEKADFKNLENIA